MSKRLVTILWGIAGLLAALTFAVKSWQSRETKDPSALSQGAVMLESLPLTDVASVRVEDFEESVTLKRDEEQWSVVERGNYKADFAKLTRLLRSLSEMTVAQSRKAGPAYNNRFGMDEEAETQDEHGYQITFLDADQNELQSLLVGKSTAAEDADPRSPAGQFVRLGSDPESVYSVNETFPDLIAKPAEWLDRDFIAIENIETISLAPGKESRINGWTVSRPDEKADFTIENMAEGREPQTDKLTALKSVLSGPDFEDVLTEEDALTHRDEGKINELSITTFDGFKYDLAYGPPKKRDPEAGPEEPAAPVGYITKIAVSGDFPTERPKKEGESEEEAAAADLAFKEKLEALQARLKHEQSFSDRYYLLAAYVLSPVDIGTEALAKPVVRTEAIQPTVKGPPSPSSGVVPSAGPLAPPPVAPQPSPGRRSVASPPVAVPPAATKPAKPPTDEPTTAVPPSVTPPATKAPTAPPAAQPAKPKPGKVEEEPPAPANDENGANNSDAMNGLTEEDIKRIVEDAREADAKGAEPAEGDVAK